MADQDKDDKQARRLILQAMVSMAAADGELEARELETIYRLFQQVTGTEIGELEVAVIADNRRNVETSLAAELTRVCDQLDMRTRERIVQAAYLVLLADDRISARERKKLRDFAAALKISEFHFNAILEDLSDLSAP